MEMKDHIQDNDCPFCKYHHDRALGIDGTQPPKDGDYSMCHNCGELSVYEGDKLRVPTRNEYLEIATDPDIQWVRTAWHKFRSEKEKVQ